MKKLLFAIFLFTNFILSFSNELYKGEAKIIESRFSYEYQNPKIGDIQLKNLEYDLEFYTNTALLEIEIETFHGDGGWSKLKKEDIDKFLKGLADEIRKEINNPELSVNIIVEVEREISFGDSDEVVLNKLY